MQFSSDSKNNLPVGTLRLVQSAILVVLVFVGGFLAGRFIDIPGLPGLGSSVVITGDKSGDVEEINFDLFWKVWNTLASQYVDSKSVDYEKMFYGALHGLVNSFDDPATIFLDPEETDSFNEGNAGKLFEGIGAELGYEDGQIVVIAPLSGSPAEKAGVKSGDIILKVDGGEIKASETVYDVVNRIRGKSGTEVAITVLHKGDNKTTEIKITRGEITVPSIEVKKAKNTSGFMILDVGRFTDTSLQAWESEWDKAVEKVAGSKGVILDLRGNPGGYFDAAIYAASDFLEKGATIAKQEDRNGNQTSYKVTRKGKLLDVPVVLLVDGGSASASEILSGALQMNNRAVVIGENSYGKGTAQSIVPLSNGSSLHVTTLKWLLPDGTWLNHENTIVPDIKVEFSEEKFKEGTDNQLNAAVKELNKEIN